MTSGSNCRYLKRPETKGVSRNRSNIDIKPEMKPLRILLSFLLFIPNLIHAASYYINATGSLGSGNGSSAANAADASSAAKLAAIVLGRNKSGTTIVYALAPITRLAIYKWPMV
jgi:hypothetical protein